MKSLRGLGFLLMTIVIYLGVPLLGWGREALGGFFASAPRAAYAGVVLLFGLAVGLQAIEHPEGIRGGKEQEGKRGPRQHVVRLAIVSALYGGLFLLPVADRRSLCGRADY